MALGTRAISRIQGSGNGGFSGAKKLADLYAATNTNENGEVKDPGVYDNIINNILAPYAGTIDGQNLIADYKNKSKKLTNDKNESETSVAALKQKEYSAWYVDDDGEDNTSFRNPSWVADVTSQSLDMILAEALALREEKSADNKDVAELDGYINELTRRSDRMRTVSTSLQNGGDLNTDGYGYYVDADPNTGVIRGASFMPTDASFTELSKNTVRTDSMVDVNGQQIPVYLPYVKNSEGENVARFGGVEYKGDGNLLVGAEGVTPLTDRTRYQSNLGGIEMNKIYETFTGKTNVDGSFKKDYLYVSPENKIYRFGEDDQKGKQLIDSLKNISGLNSIPRLSPADAGKFFSEPLPDDTGGFINSASSQARIQKYQLEQAQYDAEVERLKNQGTFSQFTENVGDVLKSAPGDFVNNVSEGIKSFFGRKNQANVPDQPVASINGASSAKDVIDKGASFFRNLV